MTLSDVFAIFLWIAGIPGIIVALIFPGAGLAMFAVIFAALWILLAYYWLAEWIAER